MGGMEMTGKVFVVRRSRPTVSRPVVASQPHVFAPHPYRPAISASILRTFAATRLVVG